MALALPEHPPSPLPLWVAANPTPWFLTTPRELQVIWNRRWGRTQRCRRRNVRWRRRVRLVLSNWA
eukprot:888739-Alexandrium_andersonii.AAC.1